MSTDWIEGTIDEFFKGCLIGILILLIIGIGVGVSLILLLQWLF